MKTVTSKDGTEIGYEECGSGPPLVLVHGTSTAHERWIPSYPYFEEHFTVCAVDRRGRGASTNEGGPYAIEREFEDLAALIDSRGEPVDLFGHSYGGICSLGAALLTSNIRRLVLYEPPLHLGGDPSGVPSPLAEKFERLLAQGDREGIIMTFMKEAVRMPEEEIRQAVSMPVFPFRLAAAHTLPREGRANEALRFDPGQLKRITIPTLLLLGGNSPEPMAAATRMLQQVLPDARTVILPGQQHVAMETAPELLAREVLAFLLGE
jgi:pimeloyl-ACP methyl ester carboxylesterase